MAVLLTHSRFVTAVWFLIGIGYPCFIYFYKGRGNNLLIYLSSFSHLVEQQPLYAMYPAEHDSQFLYGPPFALMFGVFAWMPVWLAMLAYTIASAAALFAAVRALPLRRRSQNLFLLICLFEFSNTQQHFQTNALTAAVMLGSFAMLMRGRAIAPAWLIAAGMMVKLYPILMLMIAWLFRQRWRVLGMLAVAVVVVAASPLLVAPPAFVSDSYTQWRDALKAKEQFNALESNFQDRSILGTVRRVSGNREIPSLPLAAAAGLVLISPYARRRLWHDDRFRTLSLATVMMFVVLFSSGSENPTYIILQCGVALWFLAGSRLPLRQRLPLLLMVLLLSSVTTPDLFPRPVRSFWGDYSLRAIPGFVIWAVALWEMWTLRPSTGPAGSLGNSNRVTA